MKVEHEYTISERVDIRGKICPMTYVYTKLKLEKMAIGEILEVILDFPAAVDNIPKSAKQQKLGETLDINEIDQDRHIWQLIIKRI